MRLRCLKCGAENDPNPKVKPVIELEEHVAVCTRCGNSWLWPSKMGSRKD